MDDDGEIAVSRLESPADFYKAYREQVPCVMLGALQRVMRERGLTFPEAWAHFRGKGAIVEVAKAIGVPSAPAPLTLPHERS